MILKQLIIQRQNSWDDSCKSPLVGQVKFKSDSGEIHINLSEEAATKILAIVAEGMVQATQQLATKLTAEVIMQTAPALEFREVAP
jgi:hypothetical protein